MNKYLAILLAVILTSCGYTSPPELTSPSPTDEVEVASETQILSGAPTIEPTQEALQLALYPPGARTDIPDIDPIIDAVLNHDFSTLKDLTSYSRIGCTNSTGLGGPPKCEDGEGEGTILEVVPFLGAEGHHLRKTEYEKWDGPDVLGLLAAYTTSQGTFRDPNYPAGEYGLVFLVAETTVSITLQVMDGRIIRYDYDFSGQTADTIKQKADQVLLPIRYNPVPTQVAWNSFEDPQRRFSFLYPPTMDLLQVEQENNWQIGSSIRVEILPYEISWITCFYRSMGDCPFVEGDLNLEINGHQVRRIEGYIGSVGGNIPQEFLTYIFNLNEQALVMTVYALPLNIQISDPGTVFPLEGIELELFERMVQTVHLD